MVGRSVRAAKWKSETRNPNRYALAYFSDFGFRPSFGLRISGFGLRYAARGIDEGFRDYRFRFCTFAATFSRSALSRINPVASSWL